MIRATVRRPVLRIRDHTVTRRADTLAGEEPMEIRIAGRPLAVTMRTPGDDFDLAVGFLVSEGLIGDGADVQSIRYCAGKVPGTGEDGINTYNVVDVSLTPGVPLPDHRHERNTAITSACGLCGRTSLDAVRTASRFDVATDPATIDLTTLTTLAPRLRETQRIFERTGGLHAAGLFTTDGELLTIREDVGRHNAVDKVIGHATRTGLLPLRDTVLIVSGRASFELVQKAVLAGIPILAAVSAPSSLAADLAEDQGLTLVGFLRGTSLNIYTRTDRIDLATKRARDSA